MDEQLTEQDIGLFIDWMNTSGPNFVDQVPNGMQSYSQFSKEGQVVDIDGVVLPHLRQFYGLFKTGSKATNTNEITPTENIEIPNNQNIETTNNQNINVDDNQINFGVSNNQPMMDRNFGSLGYVDQARQLIPDAAPADPAMAALLYFSKMGELASQPGSTVLSSAAGAFSSPAQYLLEREQAKERVAKERATVAAQLGRAGKGGTGKERMRDQVLRVAQALSQGLSLSPNDYAELVFNIRELRKDKTTTLPDGRQVKEPGVNMMEIIRQTYGDQVYNAILSRLTGDSSTTTIIDPDKEQPKQDVNTILFGDKELNIVSEKDLTAPQATAIANARSAISNLKIAYDYFMADNLSASEFRIRLGSPNLGEKRTAISALRRALEILLRLRTGAAAPQSEVDNYMNMYAPSIFDTKRNVKIKFDDMMAFFQNIQKGITRSQNYQYDEGNNKSTKLPDVNLEKVIPNLDADLTEDELTEDGITITNDGKILIEVN
jgi:hypothetical protein